MAAGSLSIIPPRNPAPSPLTPYLKSYPYLFVRERDQKDYFCTICDSYLKEEQLQSHLFDGHRADSLSEYFVRLHVESAGQPGIYQPATKNSISSTSLYICVVCWAKISNANDMPMHRSTCKTGGGGGGGQNLVGGIVQGGEPTKVVSTPDLPAMLVDTENDGRTSPAQSPSSSQGSLIIDVPDNVPPTAPVPSSFPTILGNGNKTFQPLPPPAQPVKRGRKKQLYPQQVLKNVTPSKSPSASLDSAGIDLRDQIQKQLVHSLPSSLLHQAPAQSHSRPPPSPSPQQHQQQHFASNCIQCSLCGSILHSPTYMKHLREFHRVACSLDSSSCPLCMGTVPLMDMTVHLSAMHGVAPQPAVNAILLWTLANNTFVMNEKTKESLRSKTIAVTSSGASFDGGTAATTCSASLLPPSVSVPSTTTSSEPLEKSTTWKLPVSTTELNATHPSHTQPAVVNGQASAVAVQAAVSAMANATRIPSFLQALLNGEMPGNASMSNPGGLTPKLTIESIVQKLTRNHVGPNNKESFQCLVCCKWFAVPPIKHMRGHIMNAKERKQRLLPLLGGSSHACLVCYQIFDSLDGIDVHQATAHANEPVASSDGNDQDDLPLGATFETTNKNPNVPTVIAAVNNSNAKTAYATASVSKGPSSRSTPTKSIELDNAGRVKSGKVRKQCELCGQWSNIKWFFKHMSEVHQALFCRCCREYLPIPEQEEHRKWHAEPPYMGQKIRIEQGQPVIIDRKERASLTPIGSLASWGGSSGGMVVKAIDDGVVPQLPSSRKRKPKPPKNSGQNDALSGLGLLNSGVTMSSPTLVTPPPNKIPHLLPQHHLELSSSFGNYSNANTNSSSPSSNASYSPQSSSPSAAAAGAVKDTLMPKETCPVCGILITYKNLARHIKLRHKIKYKFCHKCRKLVPNDTYEQHKMTCKEVAMPADGPMNSLTTTFSMETGSSLSITPTTITTRLNPTLPGGSIKGQIDANDFLDMNASTSAVVVAPPPIQFRMKTLMNPNNEEGSVAATEEAEETECDDKDAKLNNPNPTSKTKLDSLMGKEFKHPRRKCSICNYTVSYSNFKRHLRNAHPNEYNKYDSESELDFGKAITTLSQPVVNEEPHQQQQQQQQLVYNQETEEPVDDDKGEEEEDEEEEEEEEETEDKKQSSFVSCQICGDHILEDFLSRHLMLNHPEDSEATSEAPETEEEKNQEDEDNDKEDEVHAKEARGRHGKKPAVTRACPVCAHETRSELMIKHCKLAHKISCKWCHQCDKYLLKKFYRSHAKKHERNEKIDPDDDEELVKLTTGCNLRINTRNNSSHIVAPDEDQEEHDEPPPDDGAIASLKIKNLSELINPLKLSHASTPSTNESNC